MKDNLQDIQKYQRIFEASSDAIAINNINKNGSLSKIVEVNSMASKIFGYSKKELLNRYLSDFEEGTTEEKIKLMEKRKATLFKEKEVDFEMKSIRKNGEYAYLKIKSIIIENKTESYLIHIIKDITERKKIEKDLKQSKEEFKIMFENTPIATWYEDYTEVFKYFDILKKDGVKDLDNFLNNNPNELVKFTKLVKIINLNKAALEIYNTHTPQELMSSFDVKFNNSLYKSFKEALISVWDGNLHGEYESKITTFTGSEKDVIINYKRLPSIDNKSIHYLITLKDITENKKVEEARIRNHSLNALGEMASSVAHDFNNSLQAILGNLELALYDENISNDTLELLNVVKIAAIDAANRVKIVRRFGKKKDDVNYDLLDLEDLIHDVIIQSKPIWKDNTEKIGVSINIVTHYNNVPKILGNTSELRSVIYNILKNSIEAMPTGGVITFLTKKNNKQVELFISDTGKGMSKDVQDKVFQPFYTTKGFELGRGLGMSGSYSIIKEHKGNISIDSTINKGTTVKIIFPYPDSKEYYQNVKTDRVKKNKNSKKLNILWVDDENMIRDIAQKYIDLAGHNGRTAEDGLAALALLKQDKYDLVITDIGMPNMNGWQLIDKIREIYNDKIKVIVVTGWGSKVPKGINQTPPFYASLQKPIQFKDLKKIIEMI